MARAPGNTLLPRRRTGLRRDSVANASQIATINKSDLDELVGTLPRDLMERVAAGIRWFFDLG
jgi:mRNA interferase MazF